MVCGVCYAVSLGVGNGCEHLGVAAKCLCRYAAAVEACAASLVTLYDCHCLAVTCGVLCGLVSTGAAAYDDDVCVHGKWFVLG